ncbi:hypothetical protein J5N97_021192 [Dioscorea zingiberensis]|uniref:Uncharacterized protein n=1 Tax=Dioscorea zingiberensis TaxID=325984 RepID=A0A9D5HEF2_9LILI|nr:hypothetical protein J5N97_021192 [Dioscorea zingiberensis]
MPPIVGVVDYRGRPIIAGSGKGRSAFFIIGVAMAKWFAYYGIGFNLITYLIGPLRESTLAAAARDGVCRDEDSRRCLELSPIRTLDATAQSS